MKCLRNCIFMICSQSREDNLCMCIISKKKVGYGETCPYENRTVTELNIEANYNKKGVD